MTAWWMLQSLTIGGLLAVAAFGAESVGRAAGRQLRWIWAAALLLTIALTVLVPWRNRASTAVATTHGVALPLAAEPTANSASAVATVLDAITRTIEVAVQFTTAPVRIIWGAIHPAAAASSAWLGVLWVVLACAVAGLFATVYVQFHRSRARWPVALLQGTRVRVSSHVGPAVMGIARAEIVVPQWLLARDDDEQRLVLEHECEHLRARDPLLLAVACTAVILLPWHPAVWWMLSRLRLAVELDCDRRLLQRGVSTRAYGSLLIELTGHRPALRYAMPAFACSPSHLERRLIAMTASRPRFLAARVVAVGAFSAVGILVACESSLPTTAEIKSLDVASAEQRVGRLAFVDTARVTYSVDDTPVTKEQARALRGDDIASMEVSKATSDEPGRVQIITLKYAAVRALTPHRYENQAVGYAVNTVKQGDSVVTLRVRPSIALNEKRKFDGLLIVDNVIVDASTLERIGQDDIASVEVLKSAVATQKYSDPRAANGVILVTTKSHGRK